MAAAPEAHLALDDDRMRAVRAEEVFRQEVRDEIGLGQPKTRVDGLWAILNSQFVSWLLGSVLIGLVTFVYNQHREAREDAQKDAELVSKLIPELAKLGSPNSTLAIAVLKSLRANKGIDSNLAGLVDAAMAETARTSIDSAKSATGAEKAALVKTADAAASAAAAANHALTSSAESAGASPLVKDLPSTVFIQYSNALQKPRAEQAKERLVDASLIAPAIQNTGSQSPESSEVRYYFDADFADAARTAAIARDAGVHVKEPRKMPMVKAARPGLIELWIGKKDYPEP